MGRAGVRGGPTEKTFKECLISVLNLDARNLEEIMKKEMNTNGSKTVSMIFRRKEDRKTISDSLRALADRVDRCRFVTVNKFLMSVNVKDLPSPGKWQLRTVGKNMTADIAIVCHGGLL